MTNKTLFKGKHKFELGKYYLLQYGINAYIGKLIKVTKCGYNFLNEETNCCLLKTHLYIPKKYKSNKDLTFLLFGHITQIEEINKSEFLHK